MQTKTKISFFAIFIFILLFSFAPQIALAENDVSVTPSVISVDLSPGITTTSSFTYSNNTARDREITIVAKAFRPQKDGSAEFYDENENPISSPITEWLVLNTDSETIPAYGKKTITFDITPPENFKKAFGGKYYVAIFATDKGADSPSWQNKTLVKTEIAVLVVGKFLPISPLANIPPLYIAYIIFVVLGGLLLIWFFKFTHIKKEDII